MNPNNIFIKEEAGSYNDRHSSFADDDSYFGEDGSSSINSPSGVEFGIDSSTDRKKMVHLKCEQQRREAIKTGYAELKDLLPFELAPIGYKMTNASILYRTVDYIKNLQSIEKAQQEELAKLKPQLVALQLIYQNYEQLLQQRESGEEDSRLLSGQKTGKFRVFQELVERWFASFNERVDASSYAALTGSLLTWLEKDTDCNGVSDLLVQLFAEGASPSPSTPRYLPPPQGIQGTSGNPSLQDLGVPGPSFASAGPQQPAFHPNQQQVLFNNRAKGYQNQYYKQ